MIILQNNSFGVQIDWSQTAQQLHNFIRGNDKVPGAWTTIDGEVLSRLSAFSRPFSCCFLFRGDHKKRAVLYFLVSNEKRASSGCGRPGRSV